MNAIILGVFWLIYYGMVSALASERIRNYFDQQPGPVSRAYRILYPLFSGINFAFLLWFHMLAPSKPIFSSIDSVQVVGYFLAGAAVAILIFSLTGQQFRFWESPHSNEHIKWIADGMYRYVRFPLYFVAILLLIAVNLIFPVWKNAVFALITIIYICIGALIRDRKRIEIYGEEYIEYRKGVKMLIPFLI